MASSPCRVSTTSARPSPPSTTGSTRASRPSEATRGLSSERAATESLLVSALIGAESLIVNQGVKRLFGRMRPTTAGDDRYAVRQPSTSSFPSGHASAAAFAASVLAAESPRILRPLWYGLAAIVALSRAYVRVHHASDVIAGVATGLALAAIARRIMKR